MKTIQIDRADEEGLKVLLKAGGFSKYAERIDSALSLYCPSADEPPTPAEITFTISNSGWRAPGHFQHNPSDYVTYERVDGPSGRLNCSTFYTTGAIQDFATLKANNVTPSEVYTVGWFRAPDGHLCEAGLYPKYIRESV